MIIKIKNFGPIKEFEIDLSKDFSIIYGKNNIGKSYAVSVFYLILKKILSEKESKYQEALRKENEQIQEELERIKYILGTKTLTSSNVPSPDQEILKRENEQIRETLEKIQDILKKNSSSSYTVPSSDIHEIKTGFEEGSKSRSEYTKEILQEGFGSELQKSFTATFGDNISNIFVDQKTEVYINTDRTEMVLCKTDNKFIISRFISRVYRLLFPSEIASSFFEDVFHKILNIYYFPASRLGIYQSLSSLSPILAELSKNRSSIKKSFEIPSIPEPVSDYFLALSSIKKKDISKDNPILQLAEEIEQTVLGGEVFFDDDTKKMIYKPYKTDLYLDMFQVSSMAAEISPLVLFLKYIIAPSHNKAESKSLLFIEEPEAHLHPETQIKLMEIFAKLVKHNIKIIITSHSNYIFNKMNNLILEKKLDVSNMAAIILEQSEQGSISRVLPTDYLGVEDENFIATTEELFNEKIELVNNLNKD